jgi:predicted nucleic acid-binding protein
MARFPYVKTVKLFDAKGADFDLLIAATALYHQLVLATLNARHFDGISSLRVEDWSM